MPVVVQCYHCNSVLELDEGFRGGVCRCSTCGSLLQVPKGEGPTGKRKRPAAPPAPVSGAKGPNRNGTGASGAGGGGDPGLSKSPMTRGKKPGESAAGMLYMSPSTSGLSEMRQREKRPPTARSIDEPVGPPAAVREALGRNATLMWVAFLLGVLIVGAVVVTVLVFMFHG